MTPFEWLAVAYFVAVATAARRAAQPRRGLLFACGAIALVIVARFTLPWGARAWLAHAYLVLGYWIPAAFTPATRNERFERWLARADARLDSRLLHLDSTAQSPMDGIRGLGGGILEMAYLLCYPLVPAAFTVVFVHGAREDVERFWLGVLAAGYVCYGTLPWTAARPPRLVSGRETTRRGLARLNAQVLGRVSHQLVTFPSGHVAVAMTAALEVARVSPAMGVGFGALVVLIAVAAVAGRYHYLIDVLLGLLVGAVIPALTGA